MPSNFVEILSLVHRQGNRIPSVAIVRQYGEDAPIHAAMKADAALEAGDLDGLATWKRILRAIEELQSAEPTSGEAGFAACSEHHQITCVIPFHS